MRHKRKEDRNADKEVYREGEKRRHKRKVEREGHEETQEE